MLSGEKGEAEGSLGVSSRAASGSQGAVGEGLCEAGMRPGRHALMQTASKILKLGALDYVINDPLLLVPYFTPAQCVCVYIYMILYGFLIIMFFSL